MENPPKKNSPIIYEFSRKEKLFLLSMRSLELNGEKRAKQSPADL